MKITVEERLKNAKVVYNQCRELCKDYQDRFCLELVEVSDRLNRLNKLIASKEFSEIIPDIKNRALLQKQANIMADYWAVLEARLENNQL
jgi:hypothetical protein